MAIKGGGIKEGDLALVLDGVRDDLGDRSTWPTPVTLDGVALCVLNSIFSTGNRSESVVRVLDRYRTRRRDAGHDPSTDGPAELLAEIRACGGAKGFADALGTQWRAWSRESAPLKAEVIAQAAELLVRESVTTRSDLAQALSDDTTESRLKQAWLGLPGQRSGLTWRYFLMNSGMPGVKADRMITRWTARQLGRATTRVEAEGLLQAAATELGIEDRILDHAVWSHERNRKQLPATSE